MPSAIVARMSSTLVSAASSTGASADAEPLRAQPDLRDRLFARDIDDAVALAGERRGRLHQQRRLADAGIAADQQRRAAHEAAAGGAVELGDAGGDARRVLDVARQRGQRHRPALARRAQCRRPAADAAGRAFLDQRVPLAAGVALAGPARVHGAAVLADELDAGFSHWANLPAPPSVLPDISPTRGRSAGRDDFANLRHCRTEHGVATADLPP